MDKLYTTRKAIRTELQRQRCLDKDHSYERYKADAASLDQQLTSMGLPILRRTSWPDGSA